MRKNGFTLLCVFLMLGMGSALANTISFVPGSGGSLGLSSTVIGGITVSGFYYDTTTSSWKAAKLYGRRDGTDDRGLGICDPKESAAQCTANGVGGGDYNELSNEAAKELIRLTLPAGYHWVSVQLSSLDTNGSSNPLVWEHGQLLTSSSGTPGTGTAICNFVTGTSFSCYGGGGGINPVLSISGASANSQYLFLNPYNWQNATYKNNDFLVQAAVIQANVPEPGSMLLLGSGIAALLGRRKLRA